MIAAMVLYHALTAAQPQRWVLLADPYDRESVVGRYATQQECNAARDARTSRGPAAGRTACVYGEAPGG